MAKKKTKKKAKKKAKAKKECIHNIIFRDKPEDPWLCCRCGKKFSDAMMRKRMKG